VCVCARAGLRLTSCKEMSQPQTVGNPAAGVVCPWIRMSCSVLLRVLSVCLHCTVATGTFLLCHWLTQTRLGCTETLIDRDREEKVTHIFCQRL
jgi:hypothetical protein